ncbi:hypothetical protein [Haloactinomyces albus]|uniref:Uncharacterized protein n=1 Tax=Haloactinomyces albus TaxID=1352928 RepID=A0AAE3ZB60_9ACTN|nr:hypothetical protein [Haloactinomyces albus]MDR7300289.1 hypothetical protein [Haloactinomyces albus]
MKGQPLSNRNDVRVAGAVILLGTSVWIFTIEWRWFVTGILAAAAAVAGVRAQRRWNDWTTVASAVAIAAGLAIWLWTGDGRWAILGLFPLLFVLIRRLATALETRR